MKKIFFSFVLLLALFYILVIGFNTSNKSTKHRNNNNTKIDEKYIEKIPAKVTRVNKDISQTKKVKEYVVFEAYDLDDALEDMEPIKNVIPISAVQMKQNLLENIKVGDIIFLPEIEGYSYELNIESHTVSKSGNISIDGSFEDNGIRYTAVITEGKNAAFLSMRTPMGNYEIELYNGKGFVYTSHSLEKTMQKPHKNDGIKIDKQ